jgi:hypothetical protein
MEKPKMMSEQLFTPYNGTGGYVERPSSIARAVQEVDDGTLSRRQQAVLQLLNNAGKNGCIWKAVGQQLNLHHGQASGVLSNLHKAGEVFMLRKKVMRCHPYVAKQFRYLYTDEQVFDTPATTRAGERRELLEQLLAQCTEAGRTGWGNYHLTEIARIVGKVNAHDARTTTTEG